MDRRILIGIATIVVLGGVFFTIKSGSSTASQTRSFVLAVRNDTMTPSDLKVTQNDTVVFRITSDSAFELHLHGYDHKLQLKPTHPLVYSFKASIAGSFDMENEGKSHHLGTLTVQPH
ncbi:MAG: hypothetical protein NVSMB52_14270 [Chloroflexota bacterium]